MPTISLSTLRRRAAAQGYRIWKVREGSRPHWEYGPYSLTIVETNAVELRGVDLDELAAFLEKPAELGENRLGVGVPAWMRLGGLCPQPSEPEHQARVRLPPIGA